MADEAQDGPLGPQTVGERLRHAREAQGLSLDDVASRTRIPTRHLQHIEREEWDALPAITYCIGFVRSYANAIGLDGAELGRQVRDRIGGTRVPPPVPEYYEPADPARVPPRSLALIAVVIAIILVVGYFIWRGSASEEQVPAQPQQQAPAAQAPAPQQPAQTQLVAGQPVTITATEEVWLRITDSGAGGTLFEGIMAPNQSFQIPAIAQQPVLRTGRPQVLRISVGGQDIGTVEREERTVADVSLRAEEIVARIRGAAASQAGPPTPASAPPPPGQ